MPLALPAILQTLWGLRYLILSIALVGLFWGYTVHERHQGAAACQRAIENATAAEHDRRVAVEAYMQQWAQGVTKHVTDLEKSNAALTQRTRILSAAADGNSCFGGDAIERLDGVLPR